LAYQDEELAICLPGMLRSFLIGSDWRFLKIFPTKLLLSILGFGRMRRKIDMESLSTGWINMARFGQSTV